MLPFFYVPDLASDSITLDEDTSKHIIQVLRKEKGQQVMLTDGKGKRARAEITDDHRKRCGVTILEAAIESRPAPAISIAISLVKNTTRFEWFLEKATEIGVTSIIPLLCQRTEKQKFRHDRLHGILVSAMIQSQQTWLPRLEEPQEFKKVLELPADHRFIAHCEEDQKETLASQEVNGSSLLLIGPEGDFTPAEIDAALSTGFKPVSLGNTRLRTETAGIVASVLLRQKG